MIAFRHSPLAIPSLRTLGYAHPFLRGLMRVVGNFVVESWYLGTETTQSLTCGAPIGEDGARPL
jgi:hypothetical protein